ncbi:MAG: hypothetical protein RIR70_1956 [Pseudomonadota bacterium]
MKTQTLKTTVAPKQPATKKSATQTREQGAPWQANFTRRLPHRVGEPLSSGGGGDAISS